MPVRTLSALILWGLLSPVNASAVLSFEQVQKIIDQGVPVDAFTRLARYIEENRNADFVVDTYACAGKPLDSVKPCAERDRSATAQKISFKAPRYVAIVDFTQVSSERRMYFIDLESGKVEKYFVTHGIGTGNSNMAYKFSNIKDSRQTSLGVYVAGGTYYGKYGKSLRMYGLDKSNDAAYNRDIVLHGAWYVGEDFINRINSKTGQKFGRLGVSWGCPAVSNKIAQKIIPLLQDGGLIYHYHADFADQMNSSEPMFVKRPPRRPLYYVPRVSNRPVPRPEHLKITEEEASLPPEVVTP